VSACTIVGMPAFSSAPLANSASARVPYIATRKSFSFSTGLSYSAPLVTNNLSGFLNKPGTLRLLRFLIPVHVRENCLSVEALEFEIFVAEMQDENLSGAACRLKSSFVGGGC